jgi:glycosyltransferase involved in cell wall biosynthesis
MKIKKLSVIIAAYNEEKNIEETLRRTKNTVPNAEIMVVDDGSRDRTTEVAKQAAKKLKIKDFKSIRYEQNQGKGNAIRVGIDNAKGDVHVQVDADSQFPPEEIPLLLKPIEEGNAEIVFGSRYCKGASFEKGSVTDFAKLASWVDSKYTWLLTGYNLTDVNAGFKAWTARAIKDVDIRCKHFGYEPEIAVMASKRGYKIVEVPINYKSRKKGRSKVSLFKDGVKIIWYLLKTKLFRR